ncbi:VF530 family protein [Pseudomonas pohangensis]|uniref:VF530 family protein n=1 Tax=Pseudomonas pohangensis TaxID=364197 RepID=UPI0038B53707
MLVNTQDPLHGITLEALLTELVARYGWDGLARQVDVRCFKNDPSIKSSLSFLRKTPWARQKVEAMFVQMRRDT